MLRNVGRKFILFLIGSSVFAAFISFALFKAGLISFQGTSTSQNTKDHNRNRRVGRIRVS